MRVIRLVTIMLKAAVLPAALIVVFGLSGHKVSRLRCDYVENPVGVQNPAPCFGWQVSAGRGFVQSAYRIVLYDGDGKYWDSGRMESDNSVNVPYTGPALDAATRYEWKVCVWDAKGHRSRWSRSASFTTGLRTPEDWAGARWIALDEDGRIEVPAVHAPFVKRTFGEERPFNYELPVFRREVEVKRGLKRATAFVCGLGQFDFFIDSRKVGDHFLDPAWTKYDREAVYVGFDVTDMLDRGVNELKVMLGNGFYNVPNERYYKLVGSYGAPKLKFCLKLSYRDGSEEYVTSDASWEAAPGPVTYSSIYGGEDYDARRVPEWRPARVLDAERPELKSAPGTHLAVRAELPVKEVFVNESGHKVYDFGQNMSGVVRLSVEAPAGTVITLAPGELIGSDGRVKQGASGSPFYFRYTASGDGRETWQPQFTYYGFRYVEVIGDCPDNLELTAVHTCNAAREEGTFECGNELFNRIFTLVDWAIRSNMASTMTDCPHREKLGWVEQDYLMLPSVMYRYEIKSLFDKMLDDMETAQTESGAIPSICPEYVRFEDGFEDSPEWGAAFILGNWYAYRHYGDRRTLERHYEAMKRYVAYLGTRTDDRGLISYGLGDWFDIGPGRPGVAQLTSKAMTATTTYFYEVKTMAEIARELGMKDDEASYLALASEVRENINRELYRDGHYDRDSQTANAMALVTGLVPDMDVQKVLESLKNDIVKRGYALTAGDVGYRYVLKALEKGGCSDVIFRMNNREDVPGYGWQLAHGATALTESWQAYDNVSNNHLMLGHIMEWFYGSIGGIRQSAGSAGFREVVIDPVAVGDVKSSLCSYNSPYGDIVCEREDSDGVRLLRLRIPGNSSALVRVPEGSVKVTVNGRKKEMPSDGYLRLKAGKYKVKFHL